MVKREGESKGLRIPIFDMLPKITRWALYYRVYRMSDVCLFYENWGILVNFKAANQSIWEGGFQKNINFFVNATFFTNQHRICKLCCQNVSSDSLITSIYFLHFFYNESSLPFFLSNICRCLYAIVSWIMSSIIVPFIALHL